MLQKIKLIKLDKVNQNLQISGIVKRELTLRNAKLEKLIVTSKKTMYIFFNAMFFQGVYILGETQLSFFSF